MLFSLFASKEPRPVTAELTQERWAKAYLGVGSGLSVMLVAATNEVLRHCRIGKIILKERA